MNRPMKVKMHCLLIVISIIGLFCACGSQSSGISGIAFSSGEPAVPPDRVDVVYFS